jgi:hypothetical protein
MPAAIVAAFVALLSVIACPFAFAPRGRQIRRFWLMEP